MYVSNRANTHGNEVGLDMIQLKTKGYTLERKVPDSFFVGQVARPGQGMKFDCR